MESSHFLPAPKLEPEEVTRVNEDAIRHIHSALPAAGRTDLVRPLESETESNSTDPEDPSASLLPLLCASSSSAPHRPPTRCRPPHPPPRRSRRLPPRRQGPLAFSLHFIPGTLNPQDGSVDFLSTDAHADALGAIGGEFVVLGARKRSSPWSSFQVFGQGVWI